MSVTASYILTQVPAAALAYWSFKMHDTLFDETKSNVSAAWTDMSFRLQNEKNPVKVLIDHDPRGGLLGAGVCRLGKIGAWSILFTLIGTTVVLAVAEKEMEDALRKGKYKDAIQKWRNFLLGVIISNASVFGIIFALSLLMNQPLFGRTIPFFCLQLGIMLNLQTHRHRCAQHDEHDPTDDSSRTT